MSTKTKIMAFVSLVSLTMVLLMVGVWALKTVNFTVGGNLSYIAPGIEATISKGTVTNGVWVNASDASTKMPLTQITRTDTEESLTTKFSYWQDLNLNFNETGDDVTITFSITNNSTSKYIILDVSTSYTSADNCTISVDTTSKTLDPQGSHTFTLTMSVTDKKANATMTNFAVVFNMQLSDTKPVDLKWYDPDGETKGNDSDGDGYYYVEMGTVDGTANGEKIKWRLVGHNGSKIASNTKPTSGYGTFILETNLSKYHAFGSVDGGYENGNNDYSTSYIREYLTGNSSYALDYNGEVDNTNQGSFLADFGITESDAVYSAIEARDMESLYADIGWATGNVGGEGQYAPPAGTTQYAPYKTTPKTSVGADKLWLMSVKEIYTIVGGGTLTNGTIPSSWASDLRTKLVWNDEFYWLRSPDPLRDNFAFLVDSNGDWDYCNVGGSLAVRPAFNIVF